MRFDRVFVAVDFGPSSLMALRRAGTLAAKEGRVRLFHAIDLDVAGTADASGSRAEVERLASEQLKALARPLVAAGQKTEVEVCVGRPADQILEAAARAGADVIVVGSHAQSSIARTILGSTAEEVARRSTIPVLIVRELAEGGPYVDRVVVAVDGSSPSLEAARAALDLSRHLSIPLVGLHVIDLPLAARIAGAPFDEKGVPRDVLTAMGVTVESDVSAATGTPIQVRTIAGEAASSIVKFARAGDLLVCGTHGRPPLERIAFGSVATHVIRKAPCPVLIVRPAPARVQDLTRVP